uniref:U-box domain containing 5 n=1 Tax=Tetraodon nigroviridis TaxID=99883 RepID=H3DGZ0_TETNG
MVLNLCLPHFNTTIHCNKLCADGYDVTNLVSAQPAVRRRGFKLEYFLRPPVQVTLKFGFQVELCRLDVELWPWGMDQGQACKRLEISTSSDQAQEHNRFHKNHRIKTQKRDFKLVGRCELREDTRVCFSNLSFSPRPPFPSPPPPHPAPCRQEALWSRGLPSLGAVTQLRVTIPFGGAASALGFKALTVWGQPARCCGAEQLERIRRIHESCERRAPSPGPFVPPVSQRKASVSAVTPPSREALTSSADPLPEDFLDPITQEVMVLPMLLPSGMSVDNSTLEEHQKREATWGRAPNDPFTGVPFTPTSRPVPNPRLKSRIDHFLLKNGMTGTSGRLGRGEEGEQPQTSRLVAADLSTSESSGQNPISSDHPGVRGEADTRDTHSPMEEHPAGDTEHTSEFPSCSGSHEERLSASLDDALLSVLCGRPSFTSNLSLQRQPKPDSEPAHGTAGRIGGRTCSACSRSVSVYSKSTPPVYRLACGHLLCRPCLQSERQQVDAASSSTPGHVQCPACRRSTPRSGVVRVHR